LNNLLLVVSIVFGVVAWGVILDRVFYFGKARQQSREMAPRVASCLKDGKLDEALRVVNKYKSSHLANIVLAGLDALKNDMGKDTDAAVIKRIDRAMVRQKDLETARLKGGLVSLEAVGAVSPIIAFIYSHQAALYLALVVTAPAIGYGILARGKISSFQTEMDVSNSELTDYAEKLLHMNSGGR
jgi:hypothetical protein